MMSRGAFKNKTDCLSLAALPPPCFHLVFVCVLPSVRPFCRKLLHTRSRIYYGDGFRRCSCLLSSADVFIFKSVTCSLKINVELEFLYVFNLYSAVEVVSRFVLHKVVSIAM